MNELKNDKEIVVLKPKFWFFFVFSEFSMELFVTMKEEMLAFGGFEKWRKSTKKRTKKTRYFSLVKSSNCHQNQ